MVRLVNILEVPLALFAFIGFVIVVPGWMWFVSNYTGQLPPETTFLAQLSLPATVMLFLASWFQPQ